MSHFLLRLRWLTVPPPIRFTWGLIGTSALACYVYWSQPGVRWYLTLATVFQLGGIFLTVWQVMEQRKQLSVGTLRGLFMEWLRSFPRRKAHIASGALAGGNSVMDMMTAKGRGGVSGGTLEDQVTRLWTAITAMENSLSAIETELRTHKAETQAALENVRTSTKEQVAALKSKFSEVVTSSPFVVVFGIWLVICGTWMQLVVALFHTP